MNDAALVALPYVFEFWALDHQLPPEGDWRTWVILGGRGAGKTRAGAEWVRAQVEGPAPLSPGRAGRVALIGETFDQVRDVMVFGDSGIVACAPPDRRPAWEATKRRLVWPNGATATAFSASDSGRLFDDKRRLTAPFWRLLATFGRPSAPFSGFPAYFWHHFFERRFCIDFIIFFDGF